LARSVKGDVVVVPFPFSDLSHAKRRPALVVATLAGDDLILCQITSQATGDPHAITVSDPDFQSGGLKQESRIRPNRLFTAHQRLILYRVGHLRREKLNEVIRAVVALFES
jgi:mRNA interferase MazF